jgi:O-antigen ligase
LTALLPVAQTRILTDSVGWLTLYLGLLLFLPSRLIVGPLGSAGAPSLLFGLGSLLLWLLTFVGAARRAVSEPQPIRIALGILLFSVGVTYVLAMTGPISPDEISPADVGLLALASWSGTLLLTHDGIHQRSRLDTLIWRFAVCGGLLAVLGLVQIATRQLWVDQLSIPGLNGGPSYSLSTRGGYPRPAGTATHPIEYGVILAMILPIALHVGFCHTHRPLVVRWLPALALAAIIPLTSSRSAYLGAAVAVLVCLVAWSPARRRYVLAVAVAGVLAMLVLVPSFVGSIVGLFTGAGDDPSITSRTDSFAFAGDFIARDPWFGRGLGTLLPKYRIFDNQYLLLLVTIGIVGTLAFLALGITAAVTLFRLRARLRDEASRDLAVALAAAVCAGFTCLFMFDAFAFPMTMGTLFLILGLGGALRRIEDAKAGLAALLR